MLRCLNALLLISASHPLFFLAALAGVWHRSWAWGSLLLIAVLCECVGYAYAAALSGLAGARQLRENQLAFDRGPQGLDFNIRHTYRELDLNAFLESYGIKAETDFQHQVLAKKLYHGRWLRVFEVVGGTRPIISSVKAYAFPHRPSYIFIRSANSEITALEEFMLLHELEHVSHRGLYQLESMKAARCGAVVGHIVMLAVASNPWQALAVAVSFVAWSWALWLELPCVREAEADLVAISRMTPDAQEEVAKELIEILDCPPINRMGSRQGSAYRTHERRKRVLGLSNRHLGAKTTLRAMEAAARLPPSLLTFVTVIWLAATAQSALQVAISLGIFILILVLGTFVFNGQSDEALARIEDSMATYARVGCRI